MRNIIGDLEAKGYSIRGLSEQWGLHRKTIQRICEGTILRDTDHLFRYLFCLNAGIENVGIKNECLSRFSCVVEGGGNEAAEKKFYTVRREVCQLLTMVNFDSDAAEHIMHIGKQLDLLAKQLGIARRSKARPVDATNRVRRVAKAHSE